MQPLEAFREEEGGWLQLGQVLPSRAALCLCVLVSVFSAWLLGGLIIVCARMCACM